MAESFLRRYQKWIMFLIAIPILVSFSVQGSLFGLFDTRRKAAVLGSFELPSGKKVEIDERLFASFGNNLRALRVFRPYEWLSLLRGEEDGALLVYRFILLCSAAEASGIVIPDSQVARTIRQSFPTPASYQDALSIDEVAGNRTTFDLFVRRALLAKTFQRLLLEAEAAPDGEAIVKSWQGQNEEYRLDYVAFPFAEIRKTLDPEEATDEALQAHLEMLSEGEKNRKFRRDARVAFEGATLKVGEADESKFAPLLEGEEFPEADLKLYFNQNKFHRFKRPPEEKKEEKPAEEGQEGEKPATPRPQSPFLEYEEVKDRVLREFRLKRALEKLIAKAKEESAREGFKLEDFAEANGLEHFTIAEPKTRAEIQALDRFGTALIAAQIFVPSEGELSDIVGLAADDFFISRITRKIPEGVPPLAEIRDKVLEDYLDRQALDRAHEEAKAFRTAAVPPEPEREEKKEGEEGEPKKEETAPEEPEDLFAKAAEAKGLEVHGVDFFSKAYRFRLEYHKEEAGAAKFLKGYPPLQELKAGEVSKPVEDLESKAVYVVRVAERRLPDAAGIRPKDFEEAQSQLKARRRAIAIYGPTGGPGPDPFAYENLKRFFKLELRDAASGQ